MYTGTIELLQWGRTLSSAEVRSHGVREKLTVRASMGPHSFKCGSTTNSANSGQRTGASMGPHSFKCGSRVPPLAREFFWDALQWGRTLSSAEVETKIDRLAQFLLASMGPHSFKCGSVKRTESPTSTSFCFNGAALFQVRKFICFQAQKKKPTGASMGPHSFKCGSFSYLTLFSVSYRLASMGPHSFKCGSLIASDNVTT